VQHPKSFLYRDVHNHIGLRWIKSCVAEEQPILQSLYMAISKVVMYLIN